MLARLTLAVLVFALAGCQGGWTTVTPNRLDSLNRKPAQFAADAAKRTYPADVPAAKTNLIRGEADYTFDHLHLLNLTEEPMADVEVWVNERFVVFLPEFPNKPTIVKIPFRALYDQDAIHFPTNNRVISVRKVQVLVDGELLDVPVDIAD
ncbi:MAG: hypothetical protein AAGD32_10920 [Planctomycetota bacterium]